jgi:hypothetical protein
MCRGYWALDDRTRLNPEYSDFEQTSRHPLAVSLDMAVVSADLWKSLGGLSEELLTPSISFLDFCLRSHRFSGWSAENVHQSAVVTMLAYGGGSISSTSDAPSGLSFGVSMLQLADPASSEQLENIIR